MPQKPDFSNPDVALLRELLNRQSPDTNFDRVEGPAGHRDPLDATGNVSLPSVPHPGGFRSDPIINGSPRLANAVHNAFKIAPDLRGRVDLISTAPTPTLLERLTSSGIDPINANFSTIIGSFMPKRKAADRSQLWLRNDNAYPRNISLEQILGHELGHVGKFGTRRQHNYIHPRDADMDSIEMLSAKVLGAPAQAREDSTIDRLLDELRKAGLHVKKAR